MTPYSIRQSKHRRDPTGAATPTPALRRTLTTCGIPAAHALGLKDAGLQRLVAAASADDDVAAGGGGGSVRPSPMGYVNEWYTCDGPTVYCALCTVCGVTPTYVSMSGTHAMNPPCTGYRYWALMSLPFIFFD